jgi:hypothetical protein
MKFHHTAPLARAVIAARKSCTRSFFLLDRLYSLGVVSFTDHADEGKPAAQRNNLRRPQHRASGLCSFVGL